MSRSAPPQVAPTRPLDTDVTCLHGLRLRKLRATGQRHIMCSELVADRYTEMNRIEDKKYSFGEARKRAIQHKATASGSNEFEKAYLWEKIHFPDGEKFSDFRQYHFWAAFLVESAREVCEGLDVLLSQAFALGEAWYDEKSRKAASSILDSLFAQLESIRNVQRESEVIMNAVAATNFARGDEHQTAITALAESIRQMNEAYKRTFDVCNLKLNSIWSRRVTYANTFIGLSALVVALISILSK